MKLSRHDFFSLSQHHLPFSILHRDPQVNYPLHAHEFSELVITTGGSGCHFTEKTTHRIARGDTFIINPGISHGYREVSNLKLTNILYNPETLNAPLADIATIPGYHALFKIDLHFNSTLNSHLLQTEQQLQETLNIIAKIENEISKESSGCIFFSKVHFLELIGHLSRSYGAQNTQDSSELMLIAKAISYIESNYTKDIEQDELAKIANLSKSHFLHIFKKTTNTTPLLYQKLLRMEKACSLLIQSRMSITEVSHKCGYHDSNYFTRQFKKVMNISPKQYRNNSLKIEMPDIE